MLAPEELHARGVELINRGRVRRARPLLERAVGGATDPELTARIEASLAYVVAETGDPDGALAMCERALARPGVSDGVRGVLAGQRALLLMRRGESASAMGAFGEALASLEDPAELGKAFVNRGNVYLQQSRPLQAAADYADAVAALRLAGRDVDAAMAQHNLGYAAFLGGDMVNALRQMDAAREVLAGVSPVVRAIGDQDRAEVLLASGLVREGTDLLRHAAHDYGVRGLRQRQGEAELVLARQLLLVDPEQSRRSAAAALRRFRRLEAAAWSARARAVEVAAEVELGRRDARLVRSAEDSGRDLLALGLPWSAARTTLCRARLLTRRGRVDRAAELLGSLRIGPQAPLDVRLLGRDVRAELAAARGRRSEALAHLSAGLAELHAWQSSFGSLDLQTGVAGHGVRLGVRGLALAVGSRRPKVLFEWSERARMLASRVQPVRAPEDEAIVADLTELRTIAREREGGGRVSLEREAELRQRVRERAWRLHGSGEVTDPLSLAGLRDRLEEGTALVAYVVTEAVVVALVATDADTTWVELGSRARLDELLGGLLPDLDVAAADLPDPMAGFVREALAGRLRALAALLVEPVLGALGDRRAVLTPSGVLAGVPWTLLPGLTGRPVTVAQSATSWLARRTTPLRSATAGFVAGPRVARAEDEVTAAAKEWPTATVLVDEAATASAVSDLAASVDVLHVAAHGRHASENAMFSGLQLSDGPWYGYDIDQLRRVPDVVLLSACEVGRSTVRWGEELIGMTTAWLHAGARCVVASAAAVNDRAAYDVLVGVHQHLAAGVDPAAALAAAVPAVTADTAPVPLVCFG